MASDLYVLHYRLFQTSYLRYHDSLESARRDACAHILKYGFPPLELESDHDDRDTAQAILGLIEEGDFDQAYRLYRKSIDTHNWDEHIEIETVTLSNSGDVPLMRLADEQRARLKKAIEEHSLDDEEDEHEEDD